MATEIISKQCSKCKEIKPISEFYKQKNGKYGVRSWCIKCFIKEMKEYIEAEKGKATRKKYLKTAKGRSVQRAKLKRFYARHPNQLKATKVVNDAVRVGKLPRPDTLLCHYCPKPAQQYHHWHGYEPEHWLDVVPVCTKCHQNLK